MLITHLFHDSLRDVEDSFAVQSEAVDAVRSVDQVLDVLANVFGELLEKDSRLVFGQGTHFQLCVGGGRG